MRSQSAGTAGWSAEVRVLVRPFRNYARLADALEGHPGGLWLALRRPLRWLLIIGAVVSLTSAGRLVAWHVLGAAVSWSFFPALQMLGLLAALATVARGRPRAAAFDLYFAGQAPWLLFLSALAGLCLFAPHVYAAFRWLLGTWVLPGALLLALGWSTLLTWAFLRSGLGLSRLRALLGFAVLNGVYFGGLAGYYAATNQLQPLLSGGG